MLLFHGLEVFGFLDFKIALRLRLLGQRQSLSQYALLVRLRSCNCGRTLRFRALDGGIALGFSRGNVGVALDPRHVGPAHVRNVLVLVADFLDGERDHFQSHLAHVVGTSRAHAVGDHLRLFHDLLDRELSNDAAQVAFHHQPDQPFAFVRRLGQELLGGGLNRDRVRLHFDLGHGFYRHRDALIGVKVLLRSHVERHQLQRKDLAALDHRDNDPAATFDNACPTESIDQQRLVRSNFAIQAGKHAEQAHDCHHPQSDNDQESQSVHNSLPRKLRIRCCTFRRCCLRTYAMPRS